MSSTRGPVPLESAYQGSKVFGRGGPFTDLYQVDVRTAKRDSRLQTSGRIIAFEFDGIRFPNEPKTAFYDWVYVNAIFEHREWLRSRLPKYAAFTDIEFNPERSINCQHVRARCSLRLYQPACLRRRSRRLRRSSTRSPTVQRDLLQREIRRGRSFEPSSFVSRIILRASGVSRFVVAGDDRLRDHGRTRLGLLHSSPAPSRLEETQRL